MLSNRQETKEKAILFAITKLHLSLYRKDLNVYTVDVNGNQSKLSSSNDFEEVWTDALVALNSMPTTDSLETVADVNSSSLHIYTDGGSRGNPGHSATGYVICDHNDKPLEYGGSYLGVTNSNTAEYHAVKEALIAAEKYKPEKIDFFCDSMLVVNQLQNIYSVKNNELWPIHQDIKRLIAPFKLVTFTHIPREKNERADKKVNQILDEAMTNS